MAASFGEKLLQEVHEEGLGELLHDFRTLYGEHVNSGTTASFGVAPIDELLELFMPSLPQSAAHQRIVEEDNPENQGEFPIRTVEHEHTHSTVPVQPPAINRPDPVLEICSTSSGAGKSQLLYYLTALAVLPFAFNGVILNGFDSAVVFIDADGRFDAERLRTIARGIIQNSFQTNSKASPGGPPRGNPSDSMEYPIEDMLIASLQHVHVFRPQSSLALLTTLQSLDAYLLDLSRHMSANRPLHAIVIDSATAFLWKDKLQDELARTEDIGRPIAELERERLQKESFYLADVYTDLVEALKRLQRLLDCAVIYTTISWTGRSTDKPPAPYDLYNPLDTALPKMPSFRSPLPPPWGLFPTLRLVLQRDAVRPFLPTMTVHEAQRDAPMRQEVVMQGKFLACVNGWGREDWPRRVVEGLKTRNGGQFTFQIGQDGIVFI